MTTFDALRDARYTGEARCWPCTAVNVVVVAAVVLALALVDRVALAAAVAVVGALAVWLRGYVVPFTPRFAPRLVAAVPGGERLFDHGNAPGRDRETADDAPAGTAGDANLAPRDVDAEATLGALVDAGVVVPAGEDLQLDDAFREAWTVRIRDRRDDPVEAVASDVADALADATVSVEDEDVGRGPYVVVSRGDGPSLGDAWLTRPVAVAELAAVEALADHDLDRATRVAAAGPLRLFLDECPACGGDVVETTTVECCGGTAGAGASPDHVLACSDCDSRLFTLPDPE
ncbi:hypothetical protein [Halorubellus litoreus]|uniref:Restriction endonuclease n=1 Tax=Halorubellus litoreus TaxID=755308 RepID=A0ABD5VAQ7_9EURY